MHGLKSEIVSRQQMYSHQPTSSVASLRVVWPKQEKIMPPKHEVEEESEQSAVKGTNNEWDKDKIRVTDFTICTSGEMYTQSLT